MPNRTRTRAPANLVTIEWSATYLGVTERTIRNFISRGQLRAFRLGDRLVRLDRTEVESLLREIPTATVRSGGGPDVA